MKLYVHGNLTKAVDNVWVHGVFYYKFNGITYQKYPIDLWESFCGWMEGKSKSYVLDWTVGRILKYTNVNHTCPYVGLVIMKVDNISIDNFPFEPLVPSGRYRVDLDIAESDRIPYGGAKLYFSVSDHRLEVF